MADDAAMKIKAGDRTYLIKFGQFNALDARLFRETLGMGLTQAFNQGADIDVIAGLLWLHRRKSKPGITYEEVASSFTYDDLAASSDDAEDSEGDEEVEGGPEA